MFHDWEDVDRVRERLRPELEARLQKAGYVVLFWGDGGWVRYFSRKPIHGLAEALRKIIIPAGAVDLIRDQLDICAIDERRLFPDLDGVAREVGRYYASSSAVAADMAAPLRREVSGP